MRPKKNFLLFFLCLTHTFEVPLLVSTSAEVTGWSGKAGRAWGTGGSWATFSFTNTGPAWFLCPVGSWSLQVLGGGSSWGDSRGLSSCVHLASVHLGLSLQRPDSSSLSSSLEAGTGVRRRDRRLGLVTEALVLPGVPQVFAPGSWAARAQGGPPASCPVSPLPSVVPPSQAGTGQGMREGEGVRRKGCHRAQTPKPSPAPLPEAASQLPAGSPGLSPTSLILCSSAGPGVPRCQGAPGTSAT